MSSSIEINSPQSRIDSCSTLHSHGQPDAGVSLWTAADNGAAATDPLPSSARVKLPPRRATEPVAPRAHTTATPHCHTSMLQHRMTFCFCTPAHSLRCVLPHTHCAVTSASLLLHDSILCTGSGSVDSKLPRSTTEARVRQKASCRVDATGCNCSSSCSCTLPSICTLLNANRPRSRRRAKAAAAG